jgi:hypothetical protein
MFMTSENAILRALAIETAKRCARGQHARGCEHRSNEPMHADIVRHAIRPRIFPAK